jgi:alkyl sulfatase BDS1-like metallo-beta-lactamase superfamily hydrolase
MAEVEPPPELQLTEEYGKTAWNVRAIWHEYTGWHDPARGITDLYGVPFANVAPVISELCGGVERLAGCAQAFVDDGKPLEALHLTDVALAAGPPSEAVREARRSALVALGAQAEGKNLWERMSIAAALRDLEPPED